MFYQSIRLHFRPTAESGLVHVNLVPAPVNVFVGPNGAGKSLALRELQDPSLSTRKILCRRMASAGVLREAKAWTGRESHNRAVEPDTITALSPALDDDFLRFDTPTDPRSAYSAVNEVVTRMRMLDDRNRVTLSVVDSPEKIYRGVRGRFANSPASRLDALYRDNAALQALRSTIAETFGLYPVVDGTHGELHMRVSREAPFAGLERTLSAEVEAYMDRTIPLYTLSDGTRTYLALWAHLLSGHERLIFLDEAGSMLHPPLARQLGKQLAGEAVKRQGHLFAATHSADFLLGCIQAGCPVNVIRLTYRDERSTVRILSGDDLRPLMHDPLLRSANVLSGLFHDGVVVCEADSDRAFYQEINERLLDGKEGIPSCHFVNAQNWQTIPRITRVLRRLGIPAAMLIDLDAVTHPDIKHLFEAAGVPEATLHGLGQVRGQLAAPFDTKEKREQLKREGLALVAKDALPAWRKYLRDLAEFGIFAVPVGELEGWFPEFEIPRGRKSEWIVKMFARMGADPEATDYSRPTREGPWGLVRDIAAWIHDPERQGMPELPQDPPDGAH